jgi:alpha-1,6-mannosyltransferase
MHRLSKKFRTNNPVLLVFFLVLYFTVLMCQSLRSEKEDFSTLFFLFSMLSAAYLLINLNLQFYSKRQLLIFTILIYGVCLFSYAPLSSDFYRFIWDGEMLTKGINPYDFLPNEVMQLPSFQNDSYFQALHQGMGPLSARHYSC